MNLAIEIIFLIVCILILLINFAIRLDKKSLEQEPNLTKLSGFEIAQKMSSIISKSEPHIIKKKGFLLDHYNIDRNVIKLTPEVFDGTDMYAAGIALNTALETNDQKQTVAKGHKFTSIMVLTSYFCIILGAFLKNMAFLHFGLIIFIVAFILEIIVLNSYAKTLEEVDELYDFVDKQELIKPYDEFKDYILILFFKSLATLPYNFINYFR